MAVERPDSLELKKRILVVEDRDDSRTILVALLNRFCGYDTIEAAKAVKENPNTAHIPIVAQSAWSSRQWKGKVLRIGMVDYLEKPVSMELMKATIERFLP